MSLPISRLIAAAQDRGLSLTQPVFLTMDGPNRIRIAVVIGHAEPTTIVAPLDIIWINPENGVALRRYSRAESSQYIHTWNLATESSFWAPQIWDEPRPTGQAFLEHDKNIGNTHDLKLEDLEGVSIRGATMLGPIRPRVLEDGDAYAPEEAIPKSFVDLVVGTAQALAVSVYQQLQSVRNAASVLRGRVTALELLIQDITAGSLPSYTHVQEEPQIEWDINHERNISLFTLNVYGEDGQTIIPSEHIRTGLNTVRVVFAEPRAGTAILIKVS